MVVAVSQVGHSQTNSAPTGAHPPSFSLEVPYYFHDTKDIETYFDRHGHSARVKEIQGKAKTYVFVMDQPYSGVDTTDLYCFTKRGDNFQMFSKTFLWKTINENDVEFKTEGSFVNVIVRKMVVLKINPPD
jgi:hypothetical protein